MSETDLPNTSLSTSVESSSELPASAEDSESTMIEKKSVEPSSELLPAEIEEKEIIANIEIESINQTKLTEISEVISQINQNLSYLKNDFETKIKYDESKEKTITSLHNELQKHRENLHFKILRSFALDVLNLYDEINTTFNQMSEVPDTLGSILQDIEDVLVRHGFELYEHESETYERSLQKVQKAETTEQPELNSLIAQRLRKGLRYDNHIVRPEVVTVYRYVPSEKKTEITPPDLSE